MISSLYHVKPHSSSVDLLRLADVEALNLAGWRELEADIGFEVAPLVRVERAGHFEAVLVDAIDRCETFVTERVGRELLEVARAAVVVELGVVLEERGPRGAVSALKRVDCRFHGGIGQEYLCASLSPNACSSQ